MVRAMHLLVFSLRRFQSQSGVELGVPLLSKKSTFVEAKYGTVLNKHKPIVETSWRPFVHRTRSPTYSETASLSLYSWWYSLSPMHAWRWPTGSAKLRALSSTQRSFGISIPGFSLRWCRKGCSGLCFEPSGPFHCRCFWCWAFLLEFISWPLACRGMSGAC